MDLDTNLHIKCNSEDKEKWRSKAEELGMDLANWVRLTLNQGLEDTPKIIRENLSTPEYSGLKQEISELKARMDTWEMNLPAIADQYSKETDVVQMVKNWMVENKPSSDEDMPQIDEWYKGDPSAFELALNELRKEGTLKGKIKWKFT